MIKKKLLDYAALSCIPFSLVATAAAEIKKYSLSGQDFSPISYTSANLLDKFFNKTDMAALVYGFEMGIIAFSACMLLAGLYEIKKRRAKRI